MFFFHRRDAEHAEFTVFMFSVERTENIKTMLLKISQIQGKPEKMVFKRHKAIAFPLLSSQQQRKNHLSPRSLRLCGEYSFLFPY